ncbi:hypothetical protein PCC7418_3283 [Halothece sp. PCC 7418]|uniref:hypothetical protein n=1 Tax=Halothece sp. (strain PCC 7418) TaxID=65093 RepID=UPI0002A06218|nr:hypothetical protein [Halothece sp. PCC 7418]AFZ45399.1 hypothetical protein PCC7418_3283 [Halothece sp. PCC 7418]
MKFAFSWLKGFLILLLVVGLTACGGNTPPKGLAPGREIIRSAIARKLTLTEDRLTTQLDRATPTDFEVKNLKVKELKPIYIADLATYEVSGTYTLKLILPRQDITQKQNEFDIYLQRQAEGKTWRLLIPDRTASGSPEDETQGSVTAWNSYLVT